MCEMQVLIALDLSSPEAILMVVLRIKILEQKIIKQFIRTIGNIATTGYRLLKVMSAHG